MEKINITIVSRDTIKPSASCSLLPPYKISIIDQITPLLYFPVILFYPIANHVFNLPQTLTNLKTALSQALTFYYPLSGRIKNNLYIDDFEAGIPYFEARVDCNMIDFQRLPKLEWLNEFVPFKSYCKETLHEHYPLLGVRVNIFDSVIAIGVSFSHKFSDSQTANCFLKSWSAIVRGCHENIIYPNLSEAALLFPSTEESLENYLAGIEKLMFPAINVSIRRFVFDAKAISTLQDLGKSVNVPKPSRIQVLTAFLWKHYQLAAARASSPGTSPPRISIANSLVNLRSRMSMKKPLDDVSGNLVWWASTQSESSDPKLCDLVNLLHESLKQLNSDYLETLKGEEGAVQMRNLLDFVQTRLGDSSAQEYPPDIYTFSSWTTFFNQLDFGWGSSSWIGVTGKIETGYCKTTVFVQTQNGKGIEAWVILDQKQMAALEQDPQFLEFAFPNPSI